MRKISLGSLTFGIVALIVAIGAATFAVQRHTAQKLAELERHNRLAEQERREVRALAVDDLHRECEGRGAVRDT